MRSKKFLLLVSLFAIGALGVFFAGCSDDDSPTNPNTDPLDLNTVSPWVAQAFDSIVGAFNDGLNVGVGQSTDPDDIDDILFGPQPPDSSNTVDDWLVFFYTRLTQGVGGNMVTTVDSIQFLDGVNPTINAAEADNFRYVHHYERENTDQDVTHDDMTMDINLGFDGIDGDQVSIDGTLYGTWDNKYVSNDSTTTGVWEMDVEVVNVVVAQSQGDWSDGCPTSGTINVAVSYTYQYEQEDPVVTEWDYVVTIEDGNFSSAVSLNTLNDSYDTQVCTGN